MLKDNLGDRMKKYEYVTRTHLMPRTPVIIRVDGKAFHTFTRGFQKPFDPVLRESMQDTMKFMCKHIQGCVLGYEQSDEITLVLIDYQTLQTASWFDYNIQKCTSVASSMATLAFNKAFTQHAIEYFDKHRNESDESDIKLKTAYIRAMQSGAMFDARAFNIPQEEVCNCLLWRQNDATRNSIQMVAQSMFSHKELHGKSCDELQEMMFQKKNINWNDYPTSVKRGTCCIRKPVQASNDPGTIRNPWVIDDEIPKFVENGRDYVEKLILLKKE